MVTAAHHNQRPRILCELFYELKAQYLGKQQPETPTARDIAKMCELFAQGVEFFEAKRCVVHVYTTINGQWWAQRADRVTYLIEGWDKLQTAVDKHVDWARNQPVPPTARRTPTQADIDRQQQAGLAAEGRTKPNLEVVR